MNTDTGPAAVQDQTFPWPWVAMNPPTSGHSSLLPSLPIYLCPQEINHSVSLTLSPIPHCTFTHHSSAPPGRPHKAQGRPMFSPGSLKQPPQACGWVSLLHSVCRGPGQEHASHVLEFLTRSILYSSCVGSHSCGAFMCARETSHLEDSISQHSSPILWLFTSSLLLLPQSPLSLEWWSIDVDDAFRTQHRESFILSTLTHNLSL